MKTHGEIARELVAEMAEGLRLIRRGPLGIKDESMHVDDLADLLLAAYLKGRSEPRSLNWYQEEARRTAPRSFEAYAPEIRVALTALAQTGRWEEHNDLTEQQDVLIWFLGLAGEAGEVCDLLKKVHGHGKPYDEDKLKKELGDVLWYLSNLSDAHGFTLEEVAVSNVDKLPARYPGGFTVEAAQAKADETRCDVPEACGTCLAYDANGTPTEQP